MIGIKFLICVMIIVISTYLGREKAKAFDERVMELQKIANALNFFRSKIEFTYEPIKEILGEISKSIYKDENNIFKRSGLYMENQNVNLAWSQAVEEEIKLNKEDKEILKMFGKLLGRTDKKGQISEIDLALNFSDGQIRKAESDRQKNVKLYKSLGLILGVGIVIILW